MVLQYKVELEPIGLTFHHLFFQRPLLADIEIALGLTQKGDAVFRIEFLLVLVNNVEVFVHAGSQAPNGMLPFLVEPDQVLLVLHGVLAAHLGMLDSPPMGREGKDDLAGAQGGRLFCHHRLGFGFHRRYQRFLWFFRLGGTLGPLLLFFSRLRLLGLFPLALLLQQSLAVLPTEIQIYGQPQAAQHDDDPSLTIQNESPLLLEVGF